MVVLPATTRANKPRDPYEKQRLVYSLHCPDMAAPTPAIIDVRARRDDKALTHQTLCFHFQGKPDGIEDDVEPDDMEDEEVQLKDQ